MYKSGKPIGFWSAVFLGVGAMVGAGIFALLGQAGAVAGSAVWLSFIYGGGVAALSGYSFGRLGATYPSAGGLVEYLVRGFGGGYFAGWGAFMLYLSGLLALALIAKTFGSYAGVLITDQPPDRVVDGFALGIIALLTALNLKGPADVATVENVVVVVKVVVLCGFIGIGIGYIVPERLATSNYPNQFHIAASIGFTFFAFEGFRVVTNTAEDMADPGRQLPLAIMTSIALVTVLYVLMSLVVFGNLDVADAVAAKDYALAQAAAPVFGAAGFTIVGIAALVSTASAINANLYAVTNVTYQMVRDGELPQAFGKPIAHSREGLLISAAIIALLMPTFNLSSLAVTGSVTILLVHIAVHVGHWRCVAETGASRLLIALAIFANVVVVVLVVAFEFRRSPTQLWYLAAFVLAAALLEWAFRRNPERALTTRGDSLSASTCQGAGPASSGDG